MWGLLFVAGDKFCQCPAMGAFECDVDMLLSLLMLSEVCFVDVLLALKID